jgi:flagellar basal-body rod modification protein FlgD
MTISTLANTSTAGSATVTSTAPTAAQTLAETQARFYKLLVAQMQNQDPTNPMDNSQMTSQIAQMNTVSGINQLNTTVQSLASTLQGSQAMQSANLLGRQVLVPGTRLQLSQGQANFGANLSQAVDTANVTINDSTGKTVRTLALGAQPAGIQNFTWDGTTDTGQTAPDGAYSFDLQASQSAQPVTAATLSSGLVQSVSMATSGLKLNLSGLGNVVFSDLQQVR